MEKQLTQEEKEFLTYYNEIPTIAVPIINEKIQEAVLEIKKIIDKDVPFIELYKCVSFAMIGIIEALDKEYKITDEIKNEIVTDLSGFLDIFTSKSRGMKELYIAPHILVDMISYMQWQRMNELENEEVNVYEN